MIELWNVRATITRCLEPRLLTQFFKCWASSYNAVIDVICTGCVVCTMVTGLIGMSDEAFQTRRLEGFACALVVF